MVHMRTKAALLAGIACLVWSGQANAQTDPQTGVSNDDAVTSDPSDNSDIVVTGSRIQNGNNSPTPVTSSQLISSTTSARQRSPMD